MEFQPPYSPDISNSRKFISTLTGLTAELNKFRILNGLEYTRRLQKLFFDCQSSYLSAQQAEHYKEDSLFWAFQKSVISPLWNLNLLFDLGSFIKEFNIFKLPIGIIEPLKITEFAIDFDYMGPSLLWDNSIKPTFPALAVPFPVGENRSLLIDGNHRLTAAINSKLPTFSVSFASAKQFNRFIVGDFQKNYYALINRRIFWMYFQRSTNFRPLTIDLEEEFSTYFFFPT